MWPRILNSDESLKLTNVLGGGGVFGTSNFRMVIIMVIISAPCGLQSENSCPDCLPLPRQIWSMKSTCVLVIPVILTGFPRKRSCSQLGSRLGNVFRLLSSAYALSVCDLRFLCNSAECRNQSFTPSRLIIWCILTIKRSNSGIEMTFDCTEFRFSWLCITKC